MKRTNSRVHLEHLLSEMAERPERRDEVTRLIDDCFGEDKAVLVLDMSGFCRTAREHSIALVLSMIYRMRRLINPCVEAHGGRVVKAEADNLFCLFDTVFDAVQACRAIQARLAEDNAESEDHCRLDVSIGIGYGHVLNVEDQDIFGEEVNLASKLGEDVADRGEVLLTENAFAQLCESVSCVREETIEISGFSLRYHVVHRAHG